MGVGAWFSEVHGVGDFDWGTLAQDVVKAGLQIGAVVGAAELGGSKTGTPVNAALPAPYTGYTTPAPATTTTVSQLPAWFWPVAAGGGLLILAIVLKR